MGLLRRASMIGSDGGGGDQGLKPVGGAIFYDDYTSTGATYKFYDAQKVEMTNVGAGSTPAYYTVTGTPTKDKYYVFHNEYYDSLKWSDNLSIFRGVDKLEVGLGKSQTATMMEFEQNNSGTIWHKLKELNDSNLNGQNDWFVGSRLDLVYLLGSPADGAYELVVGKLIWTASEVSSSNAQYFSWRWWDTGKKSDRYGLIVMRSF